MRKLQGIGVYQDAELTQRIGTISTGIRQQGKIELPRPKAPVLGISRSASRMRGQRSIIYLTKENKRTGETLAKCIWRSTWTSERGEA